MFCHFVAYLFFCLNEVCFCDYWYVLRIKIDLSLPQTATRSIYVNTDIFGQLLGILQPPISERGIFYNNAFSGNSINDLQFSSSSLKSATLPHSWRQTRPLVWFYLQRSFSEIYLWVQLFPHLYWEKWWKITLRRFFKIAIMKNGKQFYHKRQSESWWVVILPPLVRSHYCWVGPGSWRRHRCNHTLVRKN